MPYQGTFARHEPGNYGGKIIITTQKGEWTLDNNLPKDAVLPAPGTPVSFEAEKKGNYWKCKGLLPSGGTVPQPPAYQAPLQQAYQPPVQPQGAPPGPTVHVDPKDVHIFVTGILQRFYAMQGMPSVVGVYDDIRRLKEAYVAAMTGGPPPQVPQQQPAQQDGPPAGHPAALDDQVQF